MKIQKKCKTFAPKPNLRKYRQFFRIQTFTNTTIMKIVIDLTTPPLNYGNSSDLKEVRLNDAVTVAAIFLQPNLILNITILNFSVLVLFLLSGCHFK